MTDASPMRGGRFHLLLLVPPILALCVGLITIDGAFVHDDFPAIVENPVMSDDVSLLEVFEYDIWGAEVDGSIRTWRPLLPMIWKILWGAGSGEALPFRAFSAFLHALATLALLVVGRRFTRDDGLLFTIGLLFAVHPVHAEAVGGIVSQTDLLATALGLFSLNAALARSRLCTLIVAPALLLLACLAKESAVVFGVTAVAALMLYPDRSRAERMRGILVLVAVTAAVVVVGLSFDRTRGAWGGNNIAYVADGFERPLVSLYIVGRAVAMCFVPIGLAPSHGYAAVDLSLETLLPAAIGGLCFLILGAALFWRAWRRRETASIVVLCLLFGPVLLQSNIFVLVQTDLAERLLFPATASAAVVIAVGLRRVVRRVSLQRAATGLILVLFALGTWTALRPWRYELDLWSHANDVEPMAKRVQTNYAFALVRSGRITEGAWHYMLAGYIVSGFPEPLDWSPVEALETLPVDERLVLAPAALNPENPCRYLTNFLSYMRSINEAWVDNAVPVYVRQYGECVDP